LASSPFTTVDSHVSKTNDPNAKQSTKRPRAHSITNAVSSSVRMEESTSASSASSDSDSGIAEDLESSLSGTTTTAITTTTQSSSTRRGKSSRRSWRRGDKLHSLVPMTPHINDGALPEYTEIQPNISQRLFAVVGLGSTQYKVTPGDMINAEYIPSAHVGSVLELDNVHLVGSRFKTIIGRPVVSGTIVRVAVEEQTRDRKIIVFKKNRRKRYQKTQGHRRLLTRLRVLSIDLPHDIDTY
jgi:ribosomal protein L21